MWHPEFHVLIKHEHYRDRRATAEHIRLVTALRPSRDGFARVTAGLMGHALLRLGLALLRYGRVESVVTLQEPRPAASGIKLN